MTIQQALAVAGGVSERGSTRGIKVRRESKPGSGQYREINVQLGDPVRPNDTIIVRQRRI
jgi:polysaccharide export outer membrane protein